jgi:O-antigen ligase
MKALLKDDLLLVFLLYLLAISPVLYFWEAFQSITMIGCSVLLLTKIKKASLKINTFNIPFIAVAVLFSAVCLWYFSSKSVSLLANTLLLFAIPLCSSFIYQSQTFLNHKKRIMLSFCSSVGLLSFYTIVFYLIDIPNHNFNWYFARFNIENHLHIHGTYLSLWMGIALLILANIWISSTAKTNIKNVFYSFFCLVFVAGLLIVNSRMILYAMLFLGVLLYYFYAIKSNQLAFSKKLVFILFIAFCAILMLSQRYWEDLVFLFENKLATSSRYTINYCSLQTISDSFLLGTNPNTLQSKLNACYDQYGFSELSKKNINSHNQYLDYFLKGGVLLFVAFVTLLFTKLRLAYQKQNYLYFSVTLLFCFAFLTENILVRQYGIYCYFLCDILLLGTIVPNKSHNTNKIKKG